MLVNLLTASDTTVGFTVVFGRESALTSSWVAKTDDASIDLATVTLATVDGSVFRFGLRVNHVKVGMNDRFNAGR